MEYFFRWCQGYLVCSLKGGDIERLFNLCKYYGIRCWDMYNENGRCFVSLLIRDFFKIRHFIRKTHVRLHIEKRCGLPFVLEYLKKRKGMTFGFCGCFLTLFVLSSCIWKIEYDGNSYYTEERLTKYLIENENFYYGMSKGKIKGALLEENLRLAFPEISWVSVRVEGTSLIVNLEEMLKYDTPEENKQVRYLCADADGVIVNMVTRSGTPKVTIGDEIHQGDVLIDGSIELLNDSMEVVEERLVGADGDVYAEVLQNYEKIYYYEKQSVRYGRASYAGTLSVGKWQWSFGKSPKYQDEESYEHLTHIWTPFSGLFLQIETYRGTTPIYALDAPEMAKKQAEKELSDLFHEFDEKGVQILENNVKIIMYEDHAKAVGDLRLIRSIAVPEAYLSGAPENMEMGETDEYNGDDY